jgi:copper chaperone CopZ
VPSVESVVADMDAHTVTVSFDDENTGIAAIVAALHDAGYVVKEQQRVD